MENAGAARVVAGGSLSPEENGGGVFSGEGAVIQSNMLGWGAPAGAATVLVSSRKTACRRRLGRLVDRVRAADPPDLATSSTCMHVYMHVECRSASLSSVGRGAGC